MTSRRRSVGRWSCVLSVAGLPCAALAVEGVHLVVTARGEWAIIGLTLGALAFLVGAPGTVMAIRRVLNGLELLRDRPNAIERAKRIADTTIALHFATWTIVLFPASYLRVADFCWQLVVFLLAALTLSGVFVGHALAARALHREEAPPTTSSARSL